MRTRAVVSIGALRMDAEARDVSLKIIDAVKIEALHDSEEIAQGRRRSPASRRCSHKGEGRQIKLESVQRPSPIMMSSCVISIAGDRLPRRSGDRRWIVHEQDIRAEAGWFSKRGQISGRSSTGQESVKLTPSSAQWMLRSVTSLTQARGTEDQHRSSDSAR